MIAEFSIVPITGEESLSKYVAIILKEVKKSGLKYQLTPMATIVEGETDEVFDLIKKCHKIMKQYSNRVLTRVSIDDRGEDLNRMDKKVKSVLEKMDE
ncbi:conserved hypothetical protein [Thermotomaculum hydrothermale]|uniref:Thiamine-binding protein domain-containing protein n=1 Tax=Thermotomaculum hydrothermale TaxID=981385 RepID=A0A7R6PNH2_9BACT|nr:MTH1187 family thiamine-binding protein [Thermotomaculum hydrothermale]BBB32813.1 conserved hypothetical protein [Thermotomaculum hydrothermale]